MKTIVRTLLLALVGIAAFFVAPDAQAGWRIADLGG